MKVAEAPPAMASGSRLARGWKRQHPESGCARASSEGHAGTAARPQASADVSVRKSSETSAPDVAPQSAIAPKPRTVRIRKAVDSPAIARVPLGRSEAPAGPRRQGTPPNRSKPQRRPAGSDVPAAASEKAGVRPGAREAVANSSPAKKVQKTVRTASSRRDIENDSFWRGERTDDWSTRPAAPASADVSGAMSERAVTRTGARESIVDSLPPKTARNASSRRDDAGNDFFWRDDRTDDWRARPAVNDGCAGADRAYRARPRRPTEDFGIWSR